MMVEAVITTATLDKARGQAACEAMVRMAGVRCKIVVGHDEHGEGGTKAMNWALRKALEYDTAYLAYINDDVEPYQEGWLREMIQALGLKPEYGLAGASGRCATHPQRVGKPDAEYGVQEVATLSVFTAVFKRAILEELGLIDEAYIHFGGDTDYCKRAARAGWKCIWVRHVYVKHNYIPVHQRSEKVRAWKKHDVALYRRRWG